MTLSDNQSRRYKLYLRHHSIYLQPQPPPAHPPQQQQQQQGQNQSGNPGTSGVSGQGTNSNQGSNSGGESTSGMTGHGAGSGNEGPNTPSKNSNKKSWPKKKVYKKPDPNAPKQRRFSGTL